MNLLQRLRRLPQGLRIVLVCTVCLALAGALIGLYRLLTT